jgi:hypothetical protein
MQQFDGGGRLYGIRRHEAVRALSAREHGSSADVLSARAGQVARQLAEYDRRACQRLVISFIVSFTASS